MAHQTAAGAPSHRRGACRRFSALCSRADPAAGFSASSLAVPPPGPAPAGALALSLAACGAKIDPVSLPGALRLEKGETALLTPAYGAGDATEEAVAKAAEKLTPAWSSSDEAVATVDENGLVTAVGAGRADITVTAGDGALTAVCPVTVEVPARGVSAPETLALVVNGENTARLDAKATPEDATGVTFAYASSDESVATVDETGLVTAVANGEADITVTMTQTRMADAGAEEAPAAASKRSSAPASAPSEGAASEAASASTAGSAPASDPVPSPKAESAAATPAGEDDAVVLTATTHVTVTTRVESLAFDKSEGTLTIGNSATMKVSVLPETASDQAIT